MFSLLLVSCFWEKNIRISLVIMIDYSEASIVFSYF